MFRFLAWMFILISYLLIRYYKVKCYNRQSIIKQISPDMTDGGRNIGLQQSVSRQPLPYASAMHASTSNPHANQQSTIYPMSGGSVHYDASTGEYYEESTSDNLSRSDFVNMSNIAIMNGHQNLQVKFYSRPITLQHIRLVPRSNDLLITEDNVSGSRCLTAVV